MKKVNEIFANNLKKRRLEFGLTQKALAEQIGYSEKSVSKWESGEAITPSSLLPELCGILKISIDDLFVDRSLPTYFLGIDAGGTKTEFLLVDENMNEISRVVLGAGNPVDIGMDNALCVLADGIDKVTRGIPTKNISVFAGVAGGITGDNRKKINDFLRGYHFSITDNGSDAENAVYACLGNDDGIAVILGTGCVAFTQYKGKLYRTGGYGYFFEEGGSGFSIGRDALSYALKAEEERAEKGILYDCITALSKKEIRDCIPEIYDGGKKEIARYASAVFSAAEKSDDKAKEILTRNFEETAVLIADASKNIPDSCVNVKLVGGITSYPITEEMIGNALKTDKKIVIETVNKAPVIGAVYKALANAREAK